MPTREQILAASAGWVAVLLNVIPGLGAGYLYQRRWKAYWITSALGAAWFVAGAVLGQDAEPAAEAQADSPEPEAPMTQDAKPDAEVEVPAATAAELSGDPS